MGRSRTSSETDTEDLTRGAGVNYLGYLARLGSRAPFLAVAGILYGEAAFGVFTFGITIVETTAVLALFGMKRSLFKVMSDEMAETGSTDVAVAHAVILALTTGTLMALAVAMSSPLLARLFHLPSAAGPLLVFAPAVLLIAMADILLVAIGFTRQMQYEVYSRSLAEPITLTLVSLAAYIVGAREYGLAIGYLASLTVAAATALFFFVRIYSVRRCLRCQLRWGEMRRLIAFSGPTAGYDLMIMLSDKIDVFLVSYFMPAGPVGVYGMARQFATVTKKIRVGFERILAPILSDSIAAANHERARDQIVLVSRWVLTIESLVVLFFAFHAGPILGLLDRAFAAGATALVLLMVADSINGGFGFAEFPIVYLRPKVNLFLGGGMLAVGVVANLLLISRFGLTGAGLAVVLTVAFVNLARVIANRRLLGITTVAPSLAKPLVAAIVAGGLVWLVEPWLSGAGGFGLLIRTPMLILSYVAALGAIGLEPEDRAQLERARAWVSRILRRSHRA